MYSHYLVEVVDLEETLNHISSENETIVGCMMLPTEQIIIIVQASIDSMKVKIKDLIAPVES